MTFRLAKALLFSGGAAVEAVRERRYRAARLGGIPVETEGTAVFVFKLD